MKLKKEMFAPHLHVDPELDPSESLDQYLIFLLAL